MKNVGICEACAKEIHSGILLGKGVEAIKIVLWRFR
jgi:hypothetical protein